MTLPEHRALIAGHAPGSIVLISRDEALRLIDRLAAAETAATEVATMLRWIAGRLEEIGALVAQRGRVDLLVQADNLRVEATRLEDVAGFGASA